MELYERHGQGEYRRENLELCAPEDCKDADGKWTKWVLERMTPEQKVMYDKMRELLATEPFPLNCLSDNHVMRYLQSLLWDFDITLQYLRDGEERRREYNSTVLHQEMFVEELAWNAFIFNGCYDKVGRPVFFLKWANWRTEGDAYQLVRCFSYVLDKMTCAMKPNVDQYVMVYDFEGAGYSNFSLTHAKVIMPYLQTVYCDRQFCTILIRLGWAMSMAKSMAMPFIHERTLAKFRICGSDWKDKLSAQINEDNLPKMYGGIREDF